MSYYIYKGDRLTDPALKGQKCWIVQRTDGRCVRGRNGNMLVVFEIPYFDSSFEYQVKTVRAVVVGRRLRRQFGPYFPLIREGDKI